MDQNNSYVSCIKIQGVPILPPLITTDKRKELLDYKNRALLLEKLYSTRKLNRKKIENENKSKNQIPIHTEAAILADEHSYNIKQIEQVIGSPRKYVPFKNENAKTLNLSSSIIDVSEYSLDKKENFENQSMNETKLSGILDWNQHIFCKDKYNTNTSNIFFGSTETVLEGNSTHYVDEKDMSSRPRLIRSNSYTLDNPSPLLLAHLKRQSSVSLSSDQDLTDSTEEIESTRIKSHKSPQDEKACSKIFYNSNKENNLNNSVDIRYSIGSATNGINDVTKENLNNKSDSFNQPTVEVITTDIMVQQINVTTPITNDLNDKNLIAFLNENIKANTDEIAGGNSVEEQDWSSDTETELKLILKQIPEVYSVKILDLIEKQRVEHEKGLQNYEISTRLLLDRGDFQNNTTINVHIEDENEKFEKTIADTAEFPKNISENIEIIRKARSISESTTLKLCDSPKQGRCSIGESQSLYFDMSKSCSEPLEDYSSRAATIFDHDGKDGMDCRAIYNKMYFDYSTESSDHGNSVDKSAQVTDDKILQKEKENKAASVIGAYVKGYLVRRLMKTARVQALIQTIQDALLCALELQRLETIEEADVELHRRLIQQVSAACYEFHDVFFDLTIPEQMDLITIDREKKQRIFSVKTSYSSIDFHPRSRSSSNVRLSKSLTKV